MPHPLPLPALLPSHLRPCVSRALRVLFLGGALAAATSLPALDATLSLFQYNCQTWRRAHGLPSNAITAIAQTTDGRIWLGTSKGLVRFDGVEFHVVGLPTTGATGSRNVVSLARRSAGGLWVGVERGGFGTFADGTFTQLLGSGINGTFATARVVREARDGALLFGTVTTSGRWRATADAEIFHSDMDVIAIHEDAQNRVWLGTADRGLFYRDGPQLKRFTVPGHEVWEKRALSSVVTDADGRVWVGASNGLFVFEPDFSAGPPTGISNQPMATLVDSQGVLWIGTISEGLLRYHDGKFSALRKVDGLASDRILALAESADGSLWVGTEDGLSQLTDVKFPIISVADGLAAEVCLSVAAAPDGSVWAGTSDGLSRIHEDTVQNFGRNKTNGFPSRWIKRVFVTRNGDVYFISGTKFLSRFSGSEVERTWALEEWPRAIAEDSRGILVAVRDTLLRLEQDELVPVVLSDQTIMQPGWINEVLVARDDTVWIASERGVGQLRDGAWRDWTKDLADADHNFSYLCEAPDGGIWAARNTGLVRIKDGRVGSINHTHGLPQDFIYALVPDAGGNLWMDSSEGIFRASLEEMNAVAEGTAPRLHCAVFDGQHVMKSSDKVGQEYSACRSPDGRIWLPSNRGVITINPQRVPLNLRPPVTTIERVLVNGREYAAGVTPPLEPGPGNLEFDYSALDYQAPERIRFRYRLDGYDEHWVEAGARRAAFYTNLAPGTYHFQVQAANADGIWNLVGDSVSLELPEHFYATTWFKLGTGGALFAVLVALVVAHERRRQRVVAEIREREQMQRQLVDSSPVAIAVLDAAGTVLHANATFSQLFGYTLADVPDLETWWRRSLPDPEYRAERRRLWTERYTQARQSGQCGEPSEATITCKDGTRRTVLSNFAIIRERTLVVFSDITERKAAEQAMHNLNHLLERRVATRTAELQAANRELESFSYSVSHDLRAPLRGIDGWGHALMTDYGHTLDDKARGYLQRVRSETQRMGALIDDLLNLSRTTRAEMHPTVLDLSELAQSIAQRVAEARPQPVVDFACAPGLHTQGDSNLLQAALFNLFDNAWKFTSKVEHPRVEFGRVETAEGPAFFVRDNGAGFDPAHAQKLFGVFQRMHSQREFPGTGIGLANVQRIIQRHGGRIWAESVRGGPTTFFFTLPDTGPSSPPTPAS